MKKVNNIEEAKKELLVVAKQILPAGMFCIPGTYDWFEFKVYLIDGNFEPEEQIELIREWCDYINERKPENIPALEFEFSEEPESDDACDNKNTKVYLIKHCYDTDGGFGDAVYQEDVMFATTNKELAEAYVEKYDNPVVYDKPYAELYHHGLCIEEMELNDPDLSVDPWAKEPKEPDFGDDWDDDDDWDDEEDFEPEQPDENGGMKISDYFTGEVEVTLEKGTYYNGNLRIQLWCEDGPYATLTKNFEEKLQEGYAYVDVNNTPGAEAFIKKYNLGEHAGAFKMSEHCFYPLYKFF